VETKITSYEINVRDLYEKHNEVLDLVRQTKTCLEVMNNRMKDSFDQSHVRQTEIINLFKERTVQRDKEQYEVTLHLLNLYKKLDILDRFAWFRSKMNWVHDNLFWAACSILAIFVIALSLLHSTNEGFKELLRGFWGK